MSVFFSFPQQPNPLLASMRCFMRDIPVRSCTTPVGVTLRYFVTFAAEFILKSLKIIDFRAYQQYSRSLGG
jgi:hypothetical protein